MSDITNKSEKLASALYLITSFFTDQEPLKWKLRSLSSEFVSVSMSLKDDFFKDREVAILETKNLALKITKLLSLAKNAGLMSGENHNLMETQFNNYLSALEHPVNISDFLNIEAPKPRVRELSTTLAIKDKNENEAQREKSLKEFGAVTVKKNSRQSIIIALLKRKKEVMIKDVSPLIEGCSEKTIQRELSEMVRSGVLKRMGEKRWSRYSLA